MSNYRQRQQSPSSKPSPQPGIRPSDHREFNQRIEVIEKLIKDAFDEKNQWNPKVREWTDKLIEIQLINSAKVIGILKWVDRYTICLQEPSMDDVTIVHKGAIAFIRRLS